MRLIVARCEVEYSGRLSAFLPEALRLIMVKADGSVMVHADTGGYKPLNWMTPPTAIIEEEGRIQVRKVKGDDALDIRLHEVLSDVSHDMGEPEAGAMLVKDGVERDLQELLADQPHWCGEGFRLVRREWPTDIGPVDLMCRDDEDGWIAVEIKRVATIDAVEQLTATSSASSATRRWRLPRRPRARRCSSRRRASSPRRAASSASRSTSPSCAASVSRT
jgi:RecB family endonuclease NucS